MYMVTINDWSPGVHFIKVPLYYIKPTIIKEIDKHAFIRRLVNMPNKEVYKNNGQLCSCNVQKGLLYQQLVSQSSANYLTKIS